MYEFILATSSPRRKELFSLLVPAYKIIPSTLDESTIQAEGPAALALALGRAKCAEVALAHKNAVVIGCDTVVEADGRALGKPKSRQEARDMLCSFSGRAHLVHTGVALRCEGKEAFFTETSTVHFCTLSREEIETYISGEEPYDKAGAYAIQGGAAKFVRGIEGCYFNIMGLPVAALYQCLKENGYL